MEKLMQLWRIEYVRDGINIGKLLTNKDVFLHMREKL